ncbi:hypothetical protein BST61_g5446 [Cercospora zeina]
MRLLNASTLELREFGESSIPPYYIASHRWSSDETTYKDVKKRRNTTSLGYAKLQSFCGFIQRTNVPTTRAMTTLGIERSCNWLWIDTACMDKSSSADLSECINSMFHYYAVSQICYAYLQDVGPLRNHESAIMDFVQSEWFRRGWTLQELLAPRTVVFLNRDWEVLGHKCQVPKCDLSCQGFGTCLNAKIEKITGINLAYLSRRWAPRTIRMMEFVQAWMKQRKTERIEDQAYCLLGLLGINLAPIYGERENAQLRLREEFDKKQARRKFAASPHRPYRQAAGALLGAQNPYDPAAYEPPELWARLRELEATNPPGSHDVDLVHSTYAKPVEKAGILRSEPHKTSQRTKSAPKRARYRSHGEKLLTPTTSPQLPADPFSGPNSDVTRTYSVSAKRLLGEASHYSTIVVPDLGPLPPLPVLPADVAAVPDASETPLVSARGKANAASGSLTPPSGLLQGRASLTVARQHAAETLVARSQSTSTRSETRTQRLRKITEAMNAQSRIIGTDSTRLGSEQLDEGLLSALDEREEQEEGSGEQNTDDVATRVDQRPLARLSFELEAPEELHTDSAGVVEGKQEDDEDEDADELGALEAVTLSFEPEDSDESHTIPNEVIEEGNADDLVEPEAISLSISDSDLQALAQEFDALYADA